MKIIYGLFLILIVVLFAACIVLNDSNNKECGDCPQFAPPPADWCKDGTIVPGVKDKCGCQMPPTCEKKK